MKESNYAHKNFNNIQRHKKENFQILIYTFKTTVSKSK